jgi:glutamine amidotransferase
MCRWFAYIAPTEECLLEDVLITPVSTLRANLKAHRDVPVEMLIWLNHWFANSTQAHALSKQVNEHYLPKLMSHTPDGYTTEDEVSMRNRFNNVDGFGIV